MKAEGKPVKALAVAAGVLLIALVLALVARCSEPSTLNDAAPVTRPSGSDAVSAAAAAEAAGEQWGGGPARTAAIAWLDDNTAVVTVAVAGGELVDITTVRSPVGWDVSMPPQPSPGPPEGRPSPVYDSIQPGAEGDERWQTAIGFLDAWLTGAATGRWTLTTYAPDPPAAAFVEWRPVGGSTPIAAPGSEGSIQVFAVDFEAVTASRQETHTAGDLDGNLLWLRYRAWLALELDQTGRWAVSRVSHRPPPVAR